MIGTMTENELRDAYDYHYDWLEVQSGYEVSWRDEWDRAWWEVYCYVREWLNGQH